jgi:tRNA dimethylallyltransferase
MLMAGLQEEVAQLTDAHGWGAEPMKGIGYREWQLFFEGSQDLITTRDRIVSATANLAKRQRTWFKRNSDIVWCHDLQHIVEQGIAFVNNPV